MKLLKAIVAFVLTLTMLTGCLTTGAPSPQTAAEVSVQTQGTLAALQAYCAVVDASDSELKSVCDTALTVATPAASAIQTALALVMNILSRRMLKAREVRALAECHNDG